MAVREWTDRHGNIRYTVDYYPNGRKGKRRPFRLPIGTTRDQAEKIEADVRSRKKKSYIQPANPNSSIARLIRQYAPIPTEDKAKKKNKKSPTYCELHQSSDTARDKGSYFKTHILPFFGHMTIPDLSNAHITAYKQQMKSKTYKGKAITNRTITKGLHYFSAFLKWAAREHNIRPNSLLYFEKMPHARLLPVILTLEEALAFIKAGASKCKYSFRCSTNTNPKCPYRVAYNVMFKTFFYLGLRNRAVRTMRWENFDWTKHAVKTLEKGNKVKWHPLPDDLFDELQHLYIASISEWVFPSPIDIKKPIDKISRGVARARTLAGISKRIYPHLLRHSIGTHLLDSGVDIREIQDFLGHSHISTTEFYTQVSLEMKRRALEKAGIKTTKM